MAETDTLPQPDRVAGYPHPAETRQLFGQSEAEDAFLNAWREGRLHHAWLLRGPRGIGKATLAYRIARALIADGPGDGGGLFGAPEPPGSLVAPADCPVHGRITAGSEPRLFVLRRAVADRRSGDSGPKLLTQVTVDQVRRLKDFVQLTAADGGWRVVIFDTIDEANANAANALLKVLEEPPRQIAMLLISHAPAGLLPTIRSRCRALDLPPLSPADLAAALQQAGADLGDTDTGALAVLAGGSVGAALRLVEGDGLTLYSRLVEAFGQGRTIDRPRMLALADSVSGRTKGPAYDLTVELTLRLIARMARAAATGQLADQAAPGEGKLAATIAAHPAQAPLWAEAAARIAATTHHARAVNLDPGQTIVDTFLDLDATLARAASAA